MFVVGLQSDPATEARASDSPENITICVFVWVIFVAVNVAHMYLYNDLYKHICDVKIMPKYDSLAVSIIACQGSLLLIT